MTVVTHLPGKQALASGLSDCYLAIVNRPRTVINIEETIGKQVGRRRPPADPLRVADSTISRAIGFHRAFPGVMPKRGVYRFESHAEANQWMTTQKMRG